MPAEETEQCKKVVGFGKFAEETYRYLLENEADYARWCVTTATDGNSGCGDKMIDLVNYLIRQAPTDLINPTLSPLSDEDTSGFQQLEPWLEQCDHKPTDDAVFTNRSLWKQYDLCETILS